LLLVTATIDFWHPTAGGAFGFADPDVGLGYAYALNRMSFHLFDDPREQTLRTAVYRCLGTQPDQRGVGGAAARTELPARLPVDSDHPSGLRASPVTDSEPCRPVACGGPGGD
jgi:hypothetical protein